MSKTYLSRLHRIIRIASVQVFVLCASGFALGQETREASPTTNSISESAVRLPVVVVSAQKEPTELQNAPLSVTPVTRQTIDDAGVLSVKEASIYAPNVVLTEFSARKLSFPRFRGLGASPNNPAVTTYIDGVPQLNANSSSIELLDIDQIEFVRGPQGALFGRNTVGGLINILSATPSLTRWSGQAVGTYGNYDFRDVRSSISGPIITDELAIGAAVGFSARDGYTENDVTGHDLDSREAFFGKGQLRWMPADEWEVRFLLTGERARDGDYALGDLGAIRRRPHHVSRDFEGYTRRDIVAPTLLVNHYGKTIDVGFITGGVWWNTDDLTDLDYTPAPLATRRNKEKDFQFSQEFRIASAKDSPVTLSDSLQLRWQSGVFTFTQDYEQRALNNLNPPLAPIPLLSKSRAELDDVGLGIYGQMTLTAWEKLDFTAGVRGDFEDKEATLTSSTVPAFGPPAVQELDDDFSEISPQFALMYHITPNHAAYATVARGFKAGGFNATSPAGTESYDEEDSWNYEVGLKTSWFENRLRASLAAFYTHWDDLQLNVPNPAVPGQFYIANVGAAASKGVEFELNARLAKGWDFFAGAGYNDAEFLSGSRSSGASVSGNDIPFTPEFTVNAGTQYEFAVCEEATLYARAEVVAYGRFFYDDQNTASQNDYSLANFRAGVRGDHWFAEGWVKNAFDTEYVPIALAYPGLAPSGFIGESGAPVTFGVTAGLAF
jgi:iron complex outermembrane recepter protein